MILEETEYRTLLKDALLNLFRIVRFYRSRVMYTCADIDAEKWANLSAFAELTSEHAQRILDEADARRSKKLTLDLEIPLPRIQDALADNMEARRMKPLDSTRTQQHARPRVN